jgi:cytochrome c
MHAPLTVSLIAAAGLAIFAGCSSSGSTASTPPASFAEQVARGQEHYAAHCASCHGDAGEGSKGPRVVGLAQGALPLDPPADRKHRKSRFVTVGDVADFVVANMPAKKPGSLSADQYLAILAFDLKANGIDLPAPLTMAQARQLTIPR